MKNKTKEMQAIEKEKAMSKDTEHLHQPLRQDREILARSIR